MKCLTCGAEMVTWICGMLLYARVGDIYETELRCKNACPGFKVGAPLTITADVERAIHARSVG